MYGTFQLKGLHMHSAMYAESTECLREIKNAHQRSRKADIQGHSIRKMQILATFLLHGTTSNVSCAPYWTLHEASH